MKVIFILVAITSHSDADRYPMDFDAPAVKILFYNLPRTSWLMVLLANGDVYCDDTIITDNKINARKIPFSLPIRDIHYPR